MVKNAGHANLRQNRLENGCMGASGATKNCPTYTSTEIQPQLSWIDENEVPSGNQTSP